jgi:hypothetical protein
MNSQTFSLSKILLNTCLFWAIVFLLYQLDANARMDDDYIGEQVYWLLQEGKVKSELMGGFNQIGLEHYQSVFHKLWIYNGYLFCSIGGWSLVSLHFASLIYFFIFLIVFYIYQRGNIPKESKSLILPISLLIILAHHELKNISWSFRPEVMVMTLGFISFFFLNKSIQYQKKFALYISALFAGLAFLTHLNGLIYVVAGFLSLCLYKRYIEAFIWGIIVTAIFSLYFLDIFLQADLAYFWHQFRNDPSLVKNTFSIWGILERILMEQARYLFSEKEIPLTILLVISLAAQWKHLKKEYSLLLRYTIILMLTMAIWSYTKTPYLLILHLPFFILLISISLSRIILKNNNIATSKWLKYTLILTISTYLIVDLGYSYAKITKNIQSWQSSTPQVNQLLSGFIQKEEKKNTLKNIKVLSFGSFIFNEIENYQSIKNINQYSFFRDYHSKTKINLEQLIQENNSTNIKYILFDQEHQEYFNTKKVLMQKPDLAKIIYQTEKHLIIKIKGR